MSIADADKEYRDALIDLPKILSVSLHDLVLQGHLPVDKKKREVSKAIVLRMAAYYQMQAANKMILKKERAQQASDFFVETVIYYIRALCDTRHLQVDVRSEVGIKRLRRKKGASSQSKLFPDISVWTEKNYIINNSLMGKQLRCGP